MGLSMVSVPDGAMVSVPAPLRLPPFHADDPAKVSGPETEPALRLNAPEIWDGLLTTRLPPLIVRPPASVSVLTTCPPEGITTLVLDGIIASSAAPGSPASQLAGSVQLEPSPAPV